MLSWSHRESNLLAAKGADLKLVIRGRAEEKMATSLRVLPYLDFTPFHQGTVELLSSSLRICARLERYKTEALQRGAQEKMEKEKPSEQKKWLQTEK